MYKYITFLIICVLLLLFTIVNLNNDNSVSINFLFTSTPPIPGILLFYLGIVFGALITVPAILYQNKKTTKKVFDNYVKKEAKWMKKANKTTKTTEPTTKTNSAINK